VIENRDDLLWLAGLLEGEGSFDLHREKYPRVRLAMTDRDVVGRAATLLGARVRLSLKAPPNAATWHAEISGTRAAEVMAEILPFMGARRSGKIATILGHAALRGERTSAGMPGPRIVRPPALRSLKVAA
jgi:hypothetical protein